MSSTVAASRAMQPKRFCPEGGANASHSIDQAQGAPKYDFSVENVPRLYVEKCAENSGVHRLAEKGFEPYLYNVKNQSTNEMGVIDPNGKWISDTEAKIQRCHYCESKSSRKIVMVCPQNDCQSQTGYRLSLCLNKCLRIVELFGFDCPVHTGSCCCKRENHRDDIHRFSTGPGLCPCRVQRKKTAVVGKELCREVENLKAHVHEHLEHRLNIAEEKIEKLRKGQSAVVPFHQVAEWFDGTQLRQEISQVIVEHPKIDALVISVVHLDEAVRTGDPIHPGFYGLGQALDLVEEVRNQLSRYFQGLSPERINQIFQKLRCSGTDATLWQVIEKLENLEEKARKKVSSGLLPEKRLGDVLTGLSNSVEDPAIEDSDNASMRLLPNEEMNQNGGEDSDHHGEGEDLNALYRDS